MQQSAPETQPSAARTDAPGDVVVVEAPTAADALEEVHRRHGADARIVGASKVLRGGLAGFFQRELVQLTVDPDGAPRGVERRALRGDDLHRPSVGRSFLAAVEQALDDDATSGSDDEHETLHELLERGVAPQAADGSLLAPGTDGRDTEQQTRPGVAPPGGLSSTLENLMAQEEAREDAGSAELRARSGVPEAPTTGAGAWRAHLAEVDEARRVLRSSPPVEPRTAQPIAEVVAEHAAAAAAPATEDPVTATPAAPTGDATALRTSGSGAAGGDAAAVDGAASRDPSASAQVRPAATGPGDATRGGGAVQAGDASPSGAPADGGGSAGASPSDGHVHCHVHAPGPVAVAACPLAPDAQQHASTPPVPAPPNGVGTAPHAAAPAPAPAPAPAVEAPAPVPSPAPAPTAAATAPATTAATAVASGAWSAAALQRAGLGPQLVAEVLARTPSDDLAWLGAVCAVVEPLCRGEDDEADVGVGVVWTSAAALGAAVTNARTLGVPLATGPGVPAPARPLDVAVALRGELERAARERRP